MDWTDQSKKETAKNPTKMMFKCEHLTQQKTEEKKQNQFFNVNISTD